MSDVNLNTFPNTSSTALAMLYVEKTFDFEHGTPEELATAYNETYKKIMEAKSANKEKWIY